MIKKSLYLAPCFLRRPLATSKSHLFGRSLTNSIAFPFSSKHDIPEVDRAVISSQAKQEVDKLQQEKNKKIEALAQEREFPSGALLAGALITAPLLVGSLSLNAFAMSNVFLAYLPTLFVSLVKYSGLHLTFMSGIHWGFAVSENDCERDPEAAFSKSRNYFLLSAIPMILSFLLTGNIVYNFASSTLNYKMLNLAGVMGLHIALFLGDSFMFRQRRIPHWYLNLKFGTTLAAIISLTAIGILIYNSEDKLINKNDPIRKKNIPTDLEILSGNIKKDKNFQ